MIVSLNLNKVCKTNTRVLLAFCFYSVMLLYCSLLALERLLLKPYVLEGKKCLSLRALFGSWVYFLFGKNLNRKKVIISSFYVFQNEAGEKV